MDPAIIEAYDRARPLATKPFRSACYAPFTSLLFDTTGVVRACCVNHGYVLGDVRQHRLKEIWTGERIEHLRRALRAYDFSHGCGYCEWKISFGDFDDKDLANSSIMTYKFDHLPIVSEGPLWPTHMEFHISNTCNLACATCWGEFSSVIRNRREKLPPMPKAYGEEFFEDLAVFLPHLTDVMFLGGEPFLIREHERIFEMLIERGLRPTCQVVTNGTQCNAKVERLIRELPMSLSISVDGATKETFEKIRVNAKFDEVLQNIARLRDLCTAQGTAVSLVFTLSRLNWFEFADLLLLAENMGLAVGVCNLFEPRRLSLYTLAADQLKPIIDRYAELDPTVSAQLSRNRDVWRNQTRELREHYERLCAAANATSSAKEVSLPMVEAVETPAQQAARTFERELAGWSEESAAVRVDHDADFVIESVYGSSAESEFDARLIGLTTDDLIIAMKRAFGTRINLLSEHQEGPATIREVQFQEVEQGIAHLVRLGTFTDGPGKPGCMVFAARRKLDPRLDFSIPSPWSEAPRPADRDSLHR